MDLWEQTDVYVNVNSRDRFPDLTGIPGTRGPRVPGRLITGRAQKCAPIQTNLQQNPGMCFRNPRLRSNARPSAPATQAGRPCLERGSTAPQALNRARLRAEASLWVLLAAWAGLAHTAPPAPPAAPVQGSAEQGRRWLLQRHETGCILCHEVPGIAQGGQLGPRLHKLAGRYTPQELSARIADARQFNPQTIMPPYRSTAGLQHVAPAFQGKPVLSEQALADIVSYLLEVRQEEAVTPAQASPASSASPTPATSPPRP